MVVPTGHCSVPTRNSVLLSKMISIIHLQKSCKNLFQVCSINIAQVLLLLLIQHPKNLTLFHHYLRTREALLKLSVFDKADHVISSLELESCQGLGGIGPVYLKLHTPSRPSYSGCASGGLACLAQTLR